MYRPGTLITLKDGNVYRTSKKCICVCENCRTLYNRYCKFTPCSLLSINKPFGDIPKIHNSNVRKCVELYGNHQFPKLVTLCGNQETK